MNKSQTAVEWIAERLPYLVMDRSMRLISEEEYDRSKKRLLNTALTMEQAQIEKGHVDGSVQAVKAATGHLAECRSCTEYYEAVYGKKIIKDYL